MRRKNIRVSQQTLHDAAMDTPHRFQRIAVINLTETIGSWRVSSVNYAKGVAVVVVRLIADNSIGCAVYPDGSFARANTPKITWSWERAVAASTATIPDIYVKNILHEQDQEVSS